MQDRRFRVLLGARQIFGSGPMVFRWQRLGIRVACIVPPGVAQAECLGSCLDGMVAALASIAGYAVIGIVLLVMLIRAKWRRAGLRTGAVVALLALCVPLVSQGWQAWKLNRMAGREVVGTPPDLTGRTLLYIAPDSECLYSPCEAVVAGRGKAGAYVLRAKALAGLDLSQPIALADLPLEFWARPDSHSYEVRSRVLTPDQRRTAAGRIDYLIVTGWSFYRAQPGPVEAALRGNSALSGMGKSELVRFLMAPLDPGQGSLSFADLSFDLLDLSLTDDALAIPLAPLNYQMADNTFAGAGVAAKALCPAADSADMICLDLLNR